MADPSTLVVSPIPLDVVSIQTPGASAHSIISAFLKNTHHLDSGSMAIEAKSSDGCTLERGVSTPTAVEKEVC